MTVMLETAHWLEGYQNLHLLRLKSLLYKLSSVLPLAF